MPNRTDKLRVPSLDVLWAHLRANPHVTFRMRLNCGCKYGGLLRFQSAERHLIKFMDSSGRPLLLNLRPDPRGYEWGIRFFPGGFRFRTHDVVVSFAHFDFGADT